MFQEQQGDLQDWNVIAKQETVEDESGKVDMGQIGQDLWPGDGWMLRSIGRMTWCDLF